MRVILLCLVIIGATFAGHSIYQRSKVTRLTQDALRALPERPAVAYQTFLPVLAANNALTLGKVNDAKQRFLDKLHKGTLNALKTSPGLAPGETAISNARQAVFALREFEARTNIDTDPQRGQIILAARQAIPLVRENGTLAARDELQDTFRQFQSEGLVPGTVIPDVSSVLNEIDAIQRRPLGIRDAQQSSSSKFRTAVRSLGLSSEKSGVFVAPAPQPLDDAKLIEAESYFKDAEAALEFYRRLFPEPTLPPELAGLAAKIHYNRAAMMLAHLQDAGESARSMGTGFIAKIVINPGVDTIPNTYEMYDAFVQGALELFERSQQEFVADTTMPPPLQAAYGALAAWEYANLQALTGNNGDRQRQAAAQWMLGVSGPYLQIIQTMQASPRPPIIVRFPQP